MANQTEFQQLSLLSEMEQQDQYVERVEATGGDFGLVVADAFIRGIRDIGYQHTGTALDELIDNSIQAGAQNIVVLFGYQGKSDAKPTAIAVVDDGHGMRPKMIRLAMLWGGTHRENSRVGFGRYGYGLPSAAMSQGRRYTVYSKRTQESMHRIRMDLTELESGVYYNPETGKPEIPAAEKAELPSWVADGVRRSFTKGGLDHGTAVILEDLDQLTWKTTTHLERNLLQHFGVIYRNYLSDVNIFVNSTRVEPTDPLFTTPGHRFYDLDEDRAEALSPLRFEVTDTKSGQPGTVKVRFSYMPPTFARTDKMTARGEKNRRFPILKEYNKGIIVLRHGRQIDVVQTGWPWGTFVNNDRYWGVEIDFTAELDEEFSVTTSKQQIRLSDRMWVLLEQHGVREAIKQLRSRFKEENEIWKNKVKLEEQKRAQRASEVVMEASEKFKTRKPEGDPLERARENERQLQQEVRRKARQTGQPEEAVRAAILEEATEKRYKVEEESLPGAPFFRVLQLGGMKVLRLNTAHNFYTDVYSGPHATPYVQAALELLLFTIGDCQLDAAGERRRFYTNEVVEWSRMLTVALEQLDEATDLADFREAEEELAEEAEEGNREGAEGLPLFHTGDPAA